MTEAKSTEQPTNEAKILTDMSLEELQKENERLDAELAKPVQQSSPPVSSQGRAPSTNSGETLAREVQATRRDLIRQYESLDSDEKYADEYKAEQAWAAYDKARPLLEEKASAAREKLLESAQRLEEQSIPFPASQSLRTNDVQILALTQGERARIVERLSYEHPNITRMKAAGKNVPASAEARPTNVLREEYSRGLDIGGPQGGAICRAVVGLAEDRGMNVHDLVDEHRRPWQRDYLGDAQEARIQARSIYSRVPLPSSPRPGGAKSPAEARAGKRRTPYGVPKKSSSATTFPKKKRPSWK
jgi:hypothetical protein